VKFNYIFSIEICTKYVCSRSGTVGMSGYMNIVVR